MLLAEDVERLPPSAPTVRSDERQWTLRITAKQYAEVVDHLFPRGAPPDEHGAILACGVVATGRGTRLLVRDVFLARDGIDYVPGKRGYRMLTASFVNEKIRHCRLHALAYLAVHNHFGGDAVAFSADDLRSHERGYPALLDIGRGIAVGALVLSRVAVAADIWTPDRRRRALAHAVVVGPRLTRLRDRPADSVGEQAALYSRQTLLFGCAGQELLRATRVGIIGAGGVGMPLVAQLSRLGIGEIVCVDDDRVDWSNLPRLPEVTRRDAMSWLTSDHRPAWLRQIGRGLARPKVRVAGRIARRAQRGVRFEAIRGDVLERRVAARLRDCDILLLAADTQRARVIFNAVVHACLIPGWQVGSKIPVDRDAGSVGDIFSVVRHVTPDGGCLWCNGAINAGKFGEELLDPARREAQQYVDDPAVAAPSVGTLNAIGAAHAAMDVMLALTELTTDPEIRHRYWFVRERRLRADDVRRDPACQDCGHTAQSRLGRGDTADMPWR